MPSAIAIAVTCSLLETGHFEGGFSPATTDLAKSEQPALPQPPQLAPGRSSVTSSTRASDSTRNSFANQPITMPSTSPSTAISTIAVNNVIISTTSLLESAKSGESDERHREDSRRHQSDRRPLERGGRRGELQPFAQTGEEQQRQREADSGKESEHSRLQHRVVVVRIDGRRTEHRAVGGDERQVDAQRLIEHRAELLEHDLDQLHQRRDDEDEKQHLEEAEIDCGTAEIEVEQMPEYHRRDERHQKKQKNHENIAFSAFFRDFLFNFLIFLHIIYKIFK